MVVPPSFRSSQSTITVKKGERDVVLNCEPRGEKPMTISWTRDGAAFDPLSEGHRYEVRHREPSGNGAIGTTTFVDLKIKMVERRDSTLLTCIATNNFGRAEYSINLIVQGECPLHVSLDFVIATLSYKRYTQREEVNSSGSDRDNSILNLSTMVWLILSFPSLNLHLECSLFFRYCDISRQYLFSRCAPDENVNFRKDSNSRLGS